MAKTKVTASISTADLTQQVIVLVQNSRQYVARQTNSLIVFTYFHIGRLIVQNDQLGSEKAQYGKSTIKLLSKKLTVKFGSGFSERNLELMRSFFIAFPGQNQSFINSETSGYGI